MNETLLALEWTLAMLESRDRMNAALHMDEVHYSKLTEFVREETQEMRMKLRSTKEAQHVYDRLGLLWT